MPLDLDYEFGKMAVRRGVLQQNQLEECVEVLVALERVGSRKRLWDIIAEKGYIAASMIAAIRHELEKKDEPPSEFTAKATEEETSDDLPVIAPVAEGFALAQLKSDGSAEVHPLPPRLVLLGADPECDLVVHATNVDRIHARITCGQGRFTINDNGSKAGVLVNGEKTTTKALAPYDRIALGAAFFVFLPEFGQGPVPQTDSASTLGESPQARLRITSGPDAEHSYFIGTQPLLIGKHKLANVRLGGGGIADFHAQVLPTSEGVRIIDLGSPGGTEVNGARITEYVLLNNDSVRIGSCTLTYTDLLAPVPAAKGTSAETPGDAPKELSADEKEMDWDFDISLNAEVDVPKDPVARAELQAADEAARQKAAAKPFKIGELQLICIEGPAEGHSFTIRKPRVILGRDKTASIRIEHASVSRHHAEILLGRTQTLLVDLGSKNGVYVNGKRIKRIQLRAGNTVRIGDCLFIVQRVIPTSPRR